MRAITYLAAALAVTFASAVPAAAQQSVYTSLDLAACDLKAADPNDPLTTGIWFCAGYAGVTVRVSESDLRFFISYGPFADTEPAFHQTLPPFNRINDVLEWRLDAAGAPIATILRFFTDNGDGTEGEVLVVTRVASPVCHVAYVNARANPDANELARRAADLIAGTFHCDFNSPLWIGGGGWLF